MTAETLGAIVGLGLGLDDPRRWGGGCVAWLEKAGRRCGKTRTVDYLCTRHDGIARRHLAAHLEAEKARRAKADAKRASHRAANLPAWQARLAVIDAELKRLETAPLAPRYWQHDPTTRRCAELHRERQQLIDRIGPDVHET